MSIRTELPRIMFFNRWFVSAILILFVFASLIMLTDNSWNWTLLGIQAIFSGILLIAQNRYNKRNLDKCSVCGMIRIFHDRKKYPQFNRTSCFTFKVTKV